MNMHPLEESCYGEWDRFVARAKGTIFHNAWWYRAWGVDFNIYARRGENGEIEAGMPVHISHFKKMPRILGIKGLTKPPLTLVNGPLFLESSKTGRSARYAHEKSEVLGAICSLPEVDFYDILLHSFQDDLMPYIWNGFDTQVYYTYVIPKEEAAVWRENISPRRVKYLKHAHREAEANGYVIETDPPLREVLPLLLDTAKEKGFSMDSFSARMPEWWEAVMDKGAGRIYVLRERGGAPLCASLVLWDSNAMYDMLGGMEEKARENNLSVLLYEREITDSFDMGLDFDFEGSILMGVEGFIRQWGGKLRQCYRVTKVPSMLTYAGLKGHRYFKFHRKRRWVE